MYDVFCKIIANFYFIFLFYFGLYSRTHEVVLYHSYMYVLHQQAQSEFYFLIHFHNGICIFFNKCLDFKYYSSTAFLVIFIKLIKIS